MPEREPPDPATGGGDAVSARRELGRVLAGRRHQAGLSQRQLAVRIGWGHTQVASAEAGRPDVSGRFWEAADDCLGAGGQLAAGYERVRSLERWASGQGGETVTSAQLTARQESLPGGQAVITTAAIGKCPNCLEPVEVIAVLAIPEAGTSAGPGRRR
jgi:Helix-turn-helix domain